MIDIDTLFFVIVSRGKANAVLRKAKECGATGGTIFLGEGTVQNKLSDKLGLTEMHKEILMISSSNVLCDDFHEKLKEEFMLNKRNKGIAFSIPFRRWPFVPFGKENGNKNENDNRPEDIDAPFFCLITIVDKGRSNDCIKAARAAGAKGGTLIHGRGAGIPTDFYYPLVIEPQKDIILIITPKEKVSAIKEKIFFDLELGKAGNGIIFTLPVSRATGLYENRSEDTREVTS